MTVYDLAPRKLNNIRERSLSKRQADSSQVLLRWWQDGGPLWAIALGFLTLFVWLPAFRLVSLGLDVIGEYAWQGALNLWPHPAFLQWAQTLTHWAEGLSSQNSLSAEGWLIAILLTILIGILAIAPTRSAWRANIQNRSIVNHVLVVISAVSFLIMPLILGWFGAALDGYDKLTWTVGGTLVLLALVFAHIGIQCLWPSRLTNADSLVAGAGLAILAPWGILVGTANFVWLGGLVQLPMVQLALLVTVFSCAWAAHHLGIYVATSFGNEKNPIDALEKARRGQLAALALDCLRSLEKHQNTTDGCYIQTIANDLKIHHDEAAFVFSRLCAAGMIELTFAPLGAIGIHLKHDLPALSVYDVVVAMDGQLRADTSITRRGIDSCLLYAAHVERHSLNINLFDLFRQNERFDELQSNLCDSHALPLVNFTRLVDKEAKPLLPLAPLNSTSNNTEDYDAINFESRFWEDVTLEALDEALESLSLDPNKSTDFPSQLKKAS